MVIAVITMRVMQMPIDQIVDVIAVGDRFVPAAWTVDMLRIMATALMCWCAGVGVGVAHFDFVFNHRPILGHVMQVTVVQIIDVSIVLDPRVFTVGAMLVVMIFVGMAHRFLRGEVVGNLDLKFEISCLILGSRIFHRVHDAVGHQTRDMPICQAVKDMLALSSRSDDSFTLEDSQTL